MGRRESVTPTDQRPVERARAMTVRANNHSDRRRKWLDYSKPGTVMQEAANDAPGS